MMKQKKTQRLFFTLPVFLFILALSALLLTGCGSSGSDSSASLKGPRSQENQMSFSEKDTDYEKGEDTISASRPYGDNVKLILRADLTLETVDFDLAAQKLSALVSDFGGYFEQTNLDLGSYDSDGYRFGFYTVRIPSDKFDDFLNATGDICHVTSRNESAEDVGLQYYDLESRIRLLQIKQERLSSLLQKADSMEDIISLENALSEVQYQLEAQNSEKNRYDSLISYSSIDIHLTQVRRLSGEPLKQQSFASQLKTALVEGFLNTVDGFSQVLLLIAYNILPLTFFGAILIVFLRLWSKRPKKPEMTSLAPKRKGWLRKKDTETPRDVSDPPSK